MIVVIETTFLFIQDLGVISWKRVGLWDHNVISFLGKKRKSELLVQIFPECPTSTITDSFHSIGYAMALKEAVDINISSLSHLYYIHVYIYNYYEYFC